ncbi:MAG: hypothetical protein LBU45_02585, partial [Azoarcus sp.]|nr:hypothetical protein [Azoarcus sp.]
MLPKRLTALLLMLMALMMLTQGVQASPETTPDAGQLNPHACPFGDCAAPRGGVPALGRPGGGETRLTGGDNDAKIAALQEMAAQADAGALPLLEALQNGALYVVHESENAPRVLILEPSGEAVDAATGERLPVLPDTAESVTINNRVRGALGMALAAIRLASDDARTRLDAITALKNAPDAGLLPLLETARQKETDADIKARIEAVRAVILLRSEQREARLTAIEILRGTSDPANLGLLRPFWDKDEQGKFIEADAQIREAAQQATREIEGRVQTGEALKRIFEGVSLGSILLLAALGLAIT